MSNKRYSWFFTQLFVLRPFPFFTIFVGWVKGSDWFKHLQCICWWLWNLQHKRKHTVIGEGVLHIPVLQHCYCEGQRYRNDRRGTDLENIKDECIWSAIERNKAGVGGSPGLNLNIPARTLHSCSARNDPRTCYAPDAETDRSKQRRALSSLSKLLLCSLIWVLWRKTKQNKRCQDGGNNNNKRRSERKTLKR